MDLKIITIPYIDRAYFDKNQYGEIFRINDENGNPVNDPLILDTQFNLIAIQASKTANIYLQQAIQICGGVDKDNANGKTILAD